MELQAILITSSITAACSASVAQLTQRVFLSLRESTVIAEIRTPVRRHLVRSTTMMMSLMRSGGGREPVREVYGSNDDGESYGFCVLVEAVS